MATEARGLRWRHCRLSDVVIAFSLASLMSLDGWSRLTTRAMVFEGRIPTRYDFLGTMVVVLLVTILFCGVATLVRRLGGRWLIAARLLTPLPLIPLIKFSLFDVAGNSRVPISGLGGATMALVIAVSALLWSRFLWRAFRFLLHVAAPIGLLMFGLGMLGLLQAPWQLPRMTPSLAAEYPDTSRRALWILFDEFDLRVLLAGRELGLRTPNFDAMRAESLWAEQAIPPGLATQVSLPRYLTGLGDVQFPIDGFSLAQRSEDGPLVPLDWNEVPLIFRQVQDMGLPVRVVGVGIPYCNLFLHDLDDCVWAPASLAAWTMERTPTLRGAVEAALRNLLPRNIRRIHLQTFLNLAEAARQMASDDVPGLIFAHLLMPHPPSVYDEDIGLGDGSRLRWAGYLGNIVLADREFGRIRNAMIDSGTWGRTTVIVTSDHHWRSQLEALGGHLDCRIPFLFKPVNGGPPRTLSEPFNTIVTKDLVLATLRGEVTTSEDAETWIRSNPRDFTHQIDIDETEMQSPGGDAR